MKLQAVHIALLSALVSQAAPLAQETHESAVERAKRMVPLVRAINDEFDRALLELKHETLNMKLLTSLDGRETDGLEKSLAQDFVRDYLGLKARHEAFLQYGPPQPGQADERAGSLVRKPREIHAEDVPGDEGLDDDLEPKEIVDEDEFNVFPSTAEATQNQASNDEETVSEEAVEIVEQVEPIALPNVSEMAEDDSAVEEARELDTIGETNGLESKDILEEDITSSSVQETTQVSDETEPVVEETSETDSHAESKSKDTIESAELNVQETIEGTEAPIETLDISISEEITSGMNPKDNLESNEIDIGDEFANSNTKVEAF